MKFQASALWSSVPMINIWLLKSVILLIFRHDVLMRIHILGFQFGIDYCHSNQQISEELQMALKLRLIIDFMHRNWNSKSFLLERHIERNYLRNTNPFKRYQHFGNLVGKERENDALFCCPEKVLIRFVRNIRQRRPMALKLSIIHLFKCIWERQCLYFSNNLI